MSDLKGRKGPAIVAACHASPVQDHGNLFPHGGFRYIGRSCHDLYRLPGPHINLAHH